ncbi:hypothetical protein E4U41_005242 [Claviceps citrina]|nr:hypothetical protein E4U41_005242 [Claviceps citrina]
MAPTLLCHVHLWLDHVSRQRVNVPRQRVSMRPPPSATYENQTFNMASLGRWQVGRTYRAAATGHGPRATGHRPRRPLVLVGNNKSQRGGRPAMSFVPLVGP